MKFEKFVYFLEKLEKVSSRLVITDILADLIKELKSEESRLAIYLILGRLGPDFDNQEFGMATKMVIRSVAEASSTEPKEIEEKFKKIGDMGEMLEGMAFGKGTKEKSIKEVYEILKRMALMSGEGSQDEKVQSLKELLSDLSPLERKYVARIVLGKLRLGFASKTVFDAMSVLESGSKEIRKVLDNVYQIYPDVGYLVEKYKENGLESLKRIKAEVGVPVVPALCQRLNEYDEIIHKMGDVAVERKYDGTRVQIHFKKVEKDTDWSVKTYTRNLEENSWMFPELFEMSKWIKADSLILDCEAVGYNPKTDKVLPFQMTITRKRKHGIEETAKSVPLRFFVFDVLVKDGNSLLDRPYFERRERLNELIAKNKVLVVDEFQRTNDPKQVEQWHEQYLKEGYEGAVIKKWNGTYLPGRQGWNWVKIKEAEGTSGKLSDTLDLVVLGYYSGKGKRSQFGIGAFLVGLKKGENWVSISKVGTGLTDEQFRELKKKLDTNIASSKPKGYEVEGALVPDVWVDPEIVVEIAADEITKSPNHAAGVALRFPRLMKIRDDKGPGQATTLKEVMEIAALSKN